MNRKRMSKEGNLSFLLQCTEVRYIEDIQQIHIDLNRDGGDILVVCSLLDKLCFLMVDWVCQKTLLVIFVYSMDFLGTTIIIFQRYSGKFHV